MSGFPEGFKLPDEVLEAMANEGTSLGRPQLPVMGTVYGETDTHLVWQWNGHEWEDVTDTIRLSWDEWNVILGSGIVDPDGFRGAHALDPAYYLKSEFEERLPLCTVSLSLSHGSD